VDVRQVADRAGVGKDYVRRLIDLGALRRPKDGYEERDVHLVALLHMWEAAGLSPGSILAAVEAGELSFDFLETPAWTLPERLGPTYREFAAEQGVPLHLLLGAHEAIGFAPPNPEDRAGKDDLIMADLIRAVQAIGTSEAEVLRLFRLYADNLRRLAQAEADLYVAEVQRRWRETGVSEPELMRQGAEAGHRMLGPVQSALIAIYNRHRQHVWSDHSISRAEAVLERLGLYERASRTPAVCFVDLTGYTRLTEEQGDQAAAELAVALSELVQGAAQERGGRAVKWLGDGVMLYYPDPGEAVESALAMGRRIPEAGLPEVHAGISSGPVVIQDGDYFGRTVNLASRLAGRAAAGQTLVTEDVAQTVQRPGIRFREMGPVELKGVMRPILIHEALSAR
jgi:adenylate cyclase